MEFSAYQFDTATEAIQHTDASGRGVAISFRGEYLVVEEAVARRLEERGSEFAFLLDHVTASGEHRLVSVPVND
jgi:hypothetical protein